MACENSYQFGECCDWSTEPPPPPPPTTGTVSAKSYFKLLNHFGFSQFYEAFYAGQYDPVNNVWVDGGASFAKGSVVRRYPKGDSRSGLYIATRAIDWVTPASPPNPLPPGYVEPADPNDPATASSGWTGFSEAPKHYFVVDYGSGNPGGQTGDAIWGSKYLACAWNDYSVYTERWLTMTFNATFEVDGGGTFGLSYVAKWDPATGKIDQGTPLGQIYDQFITFPPGPNGETPYGPFPAVIVLRRYGVSNADGWTMGKTTMSAGWMEQWQWYGGNMKQVAIKVTVTLSDPYSLKDCFDVACGLLAAQTVVSNQVDRAWYGLTMYCRLSNLTVEVSRLVVTGTEGTTKSVMNGVGLKFYQCTNGARSYFPVWEDMVKTGWNMNYSVYGGVCPP